MRHWDFRDPRVHGFNNRLPDMRITYLGNAIEYMRNCFHAMNLAQPPAIPMMHGRATASIRKVLFPAERGPEFENVR